MFYMFFRTKITLIFIQREVLIHFDHILSHLLYMSGYNLSQVSLLRNKGPVKFDPDISIWFRRNSLL